MDISMKQKLCKKRKLFGRFLIDQEKKKIFLMPQKNKQKKRKKKKSKNA